MYKYYYMRMVTSVRFAVQRIVCLRREKLSNPEIRRKMMELLGQNSAVESADLDAVRDVHGTDAGTDDRPPSDSLDELD